MQHDDIKLTSGAVILAALLLAATDSKAACSLESFNAHAPILKTSLYVPDFVEDEAWQPVTPQLSSITA